MRHRVERWLTLVLLAFSPATAGAGSIVGTLSLESEVRTSSGPAPTDRAQIARIKRGVTDAVVYLDNVPESVEEKLERAQRGSWFARRSTEPAIVETNQRFLPTITVIPIGASVRFENTDRIYHRVFSISPAKPFELGGTAPGSSNEVRFDRTGLIQLYCNLHSNEAGFVLVTPNRAFTRPDSLGRFRLPKLPEGTYVLHVWHPNGTSQRTVQMTKKGDVSVDLRLRRDAAATK